MHPLYIYSIYKRETEVEAVIGVTEGNGAGRSSDGVLIDEQFIAYDTKQIVED
jgi:hypothetical protein